MRTLRLSAKPVPPCASAASELLQPQFLLISKENPVSELLPQGGHPKGTERRLHGECWGFVSPATAFIIYIIKIINPPAELRNSSSPLIPHRAGHLFYAIFFSFESMRPSAKKSVNKEAPHPSVTKPCINHLPSLSI